MLAVYVNKDNPIQGLTLQQVDAIFSKTRKGGADADITTWGDLGLTGEWANKPISLYGRNSASGTYGLLQGARAVQRRLQGRGQGAARAARPSSRASPRDRYGIGYSGIGYKTADVRAVPLAPDADSEMIPAEAEHAYSGEYPARPLPLPVHQLQARQRAGSAAPRVHPLRLQQAGPGRRDQGRLLPGHRRDRGRRSEVGRAGHEGDRGGDADEPLTRAHRTTEHYRRGGAPLLAKGLAPGRVSSHSDTRQPLT